MVTTPRQQFEKYAPEYVTPMDLCKEAFKGPNGGVKWMQTPEKQFGNNPFPEPGCIWTPYTPPKVKR